MFYVDSPHGHPPVQNRDIQCFAGIPELRKRLNSARVGACADSRRQRRIAQSNDNASLLCVGTASAMHRATHHGISAGSYRIYVGPLPQAGGVAVIRREVDWDLFTVLVADPRTTTDGMSSSLPD